MSNNGEQIAIDGHSFVEEIASEPGGECIRWCIQCGTCSGSCPNVNRMRHTPREIIALARAGMREEVLSSNTMWFCVSCYLCAARCPRGIPLTDIMYALKNLAIKEHIVRRGGRSSTLARTFVENVNRDGRQSEFGLMRRYFFRIYRFNPVGVASQIPLALKLLTRGRIPFRPHRIKGREDLRAIMKKVASLEGRP